MDLALSLALSLALAGPALWKKALTPAGTLLAWCMCLCICRFGGLPAFAILAVTFLLVTAADKVAGARADPHGIRKKSGCRDAWRVLCNVGMGTAAMLIFAVTGKSAFMFAYAAAMAESLSDSLASKLGPMTCGATVDICTWRPIQTGLSGGISALGSLAALLGALLIGALSLLMPEADAAKSVAVAAIGFAGCVFDSLLGSRVQIKYRCAVCGAVVERDTHCGAPAERYRGSIPINNDVVNLLSNVFSFSIAAILL